MAKKPRQQLPTPKPTAVPTENDPNASAAQAKADNNFGASGSNPRPQATGDHVLLDKQKGSDAANAPAKSDDTAIGETGGAGVPLAGKDNAGQSSGTQGRAGFDVAGATNRTPAPKSDVERARGYSYISGVENRTLLALGLGALALYALTAKK